MAKVVTLRRQRDFDRLFDEGKRYHDRLLVTVVRRGGDDEPVRAAFIVGRRVEKRAVVRNRVKRRLREAGRLELADVKDSVDVAFIAQPAAAEASYHELAAATHRHLAEAGVLG